MNKTNKILTLTVAAIVILIYGCDTQEDFEPTAQTPDAAFTYSLDRIDSLNNRVWYVFENTVDLQQGQTAQWAFGLQASKLSKEDTSEPDTIGYRILDSTYVETIRLTVVSEDGIGIAEQDLNISVTRSDLTN